MKNSKPIEHCHFCFNAYVYNSLPKLEEDYYDTGLDDTNDAFSGTVGDSLKGIQMYINSGGGKPLEIETCRWVDNPDGLPLNGRWHTIARYYPKYCPECGRNLDEYEIGERGASFKTK